MGAIFFFSAQSDLSVPYDFSQGDLILHVVEYGVLGFLLSWALVNSGVEKRLMIYVLLAGLLYGATDELHQYFVAQRTASLNDLSADGLGSFLGTYSFHALFINSFGQIHHS